MRACTLSLKILVYATGCIYVCATHGGDQISNIWISRLSGFPVHSFEWQGLPCTFVKPYLKFWGLPWKPVGKLRGIKWKLVWRFGSRKYFKSDLHRPWCVWIPQSGILWNFVQFCGILWNSGSKQDPVKKFWDTINLYQFFLGKSGAKWFVPQSHRFVSIPVIE